MAAGIAREEGEVDLRARRAQPHLPADAGARPNAPDIATTKGLHRPRHHRGCSA